MNLTRLIFQNIRYYAKSWLITLIGVVIGTAVLTGALITGDSVQNSLTALVRIRLGKTKYALAPADRFFRKDLAGDLASASGFSAVSLLRTKGIVSVPGQALQLNRAEIIGVDKNFSKLWIGEDDLTGFILPSDDEVVISSNVASRLHVNPGDILVVKFPSEGFAPANAPFVSERSEPSGIRLKIKAIAGNKSGGRFSLDNNQASPFNIFISQKTLALKMGMPGFVNTLLVAAGDRETTTDILNNLFQQIWLPEDAGLLTSEILPGFYQVVSRRIFIEDTLAKTIRKSLCNPREIITYLVNDISLHGHSTPYSFITAATPGISPSEPGQGEIVINKWLADDLHAKPGDSLTIRYWVMGPVRSLSELLAKFKVRSVVPLKNSKTDRALMPDFPGMKNTGNCRDWETGTPIDLSKIRSKDEEYWNLYKGTPKAWISLTDGQKIWKNPFGTSTAFRFSGNSQEHLLIKGIRNLNPLALGLTFIPVYKDGKYAAGNSTDFGQLFLSFGTLIVIAGLMLSGLLLSFFLRERLEEIVLMRALGFHVRKILSVYFIETLMMSAAGCLIGILVAVIYAWLMIEGLNTLWINAVNTSSLTISIHGFTLVLGFLAGLILNIIVFSVILFRSRKRSLPSQYQMPQLWVIQSRGRKKLPGFLVVAAFFCLSTVTILSEVLSGKFYPSVSFLISGILSLAGIISAIYVFLSLKRRPESFFSAKLSRYIFKNAMLQKMHTMTAISMIAIGTFTILVTGLNRNSGTNNTDYPGSGTGGFRWWMETTLPLFTDLNTSIGRQKIGIEESALLKNTHFVSLPEVYGDDASCLNLNQVARPGLMGVPAGFFDLRRSFSFSNLMQDIDRKHPWKSLEKINSKGCINGFADQTVVTWGLQKHVGDTLKYKDESGNPLNICIAGELENSVFQGSLLISDSLLHNYYPSLSKIRCMLIDAPFGSGDSLDRILEERLIDQGTIVIPAKERLASFDAVENTYLNVFIMLGGLGLIIGMAGLAIMVMRNLRDRRRELALYSLLGFPTGMTFKLLAGEFLFILFAGICTGVFSAFVATLPSIVHGHKETLYYPALLFAIILVNGLIWICLPVWFALKSLRKQPASKML